MQVKSLLFFLLIVVSASFMTAYGTFGDYVEKLVSFLYSLTTFFVVIVLFSRFRKANLFSAFERKAIAISYLLITVLQNVYPMVIYSDQKLPSTYLTIFFIQLVIALSIARITTYDK